MFELSDEYSPSMITKAGVEVKYMTISYPSLITTVHGDILNYTRIK